MKQVIQLAAARAKNVMSEDLYFRMRYEGGVNKLGYRAIEALGQGRSGGRFFSRFDVVVDGYPRSGQSFFVGALNFANPALRVSSHGHSPQMLLQGVRKGLFAVALVREPRAASASLVQFFPGVELNSALHYYLSYYRALERIDSAAFSIVGFESAVKTPATVIDILAQRWGLGLSSSVDVEHVRAHVASQAVDRYGSDSYGQVALPTERRKSAAEIWENARVEDLRALREARLVYDSVIGRALV